MSSRPHLGKRRAADADLDDYSIAAGSIKRAHAQNVPHTPPTQLPEQPGTASVWPQQQQPQFPQQQVLQHHLQPIAQELPAGPLSPPPAGIVFGQQQQDVPATHCTDIVLYQPPPSAVFNPLGQGLAAGAAAAGPAVASALLQPPQPQQLQHNSNPPLSLLSDLGTAHNDNAALKSVWRNLTPQQRRSLANMWDVIKTEELLPRLVPTSGLLRLPSSNSDEGDMAVGGQQQPQQQQPQQQQHCIIEEVHDDEGGGGGAGEAHKQQQPGVLGGGGFDQQPLRNGFIAPVGIGAADDDSMMMAVDDGGLATRQPSVEDMEM